MLIISVSYICILIKVKFKRGIAYQASTEDGKFVIMVFVIVVAFLLCWTPFFVTSLLWRYYSKEYYAIFSLYLYLWVKASTTLIRAVTHSSTQHLILSLEQHFKISLRNVFVDVR